VKILHVCESLPGGPASYLEEVLPFQTRELSARNVILLAPEEHIKHLNGAFDGVIETYERRTRNAPALMRLGMAFRSCMERHRPDIVHFHSSFAGAVGRLVLATQKQRPATLYCAHCWSFDRTERTRMESVWEAIERWLARRTDRIVNLSPHEQKLLADARFPMDRVALVISGIADIAPSRRSPIAEGTSQRPLRILFLGRFDAQKGVDLLVDELSSLDTKRAVVDLAGGRVLDGPELKIPQGVTMLGWVPRSTLPELLIDYDAVIMPSRWEGLSIWALEVLRSGRPLIGSNRGVFPFIIKDGENGTLIDIDRPGFLNRAVDALEQADLTSMGAAARSTYEEMFRSDNMNRELMRLYCELRPDKGHSTVSTARLEPLGLD
jgi:glycosyltransferase involved in cell wall biosynthesis